MTRSMINVKSYLYGKVLRCCVVFVLCSVLSASGAGIPIEEYNVLPEKIEKENLEFRYVGGWLACEIPPGAVFDDTIRPEALQWAKSSLAIKPASLIQKPLTQVQEARQQAQKFVLTELRSRRWELYIAHSEYLKNSWDVGVFKPAAVLFSKIMRSASWRGLASSDEKTSNKHREIFYSEIAQIDHEIRKVYEPLRRKAIKEYADWEAAHPETAQQIRMRKMMEARVQAAEHVARAAIQAAEEAEASAAQAQARADAAAFEAGRARADAARANQRANSAEGRIHNFEAMHPGARVGW